MQPHKGETVSRERLAQILGVAVSQIDRWADEGMPIETESSAMESKESAAVDPHACSKRDVARWLDVPLAEVDKMVRDGCPCTPSGKNRSPLIFDMSAVFRWYLIERHEGQRIVEVLDLSLELEKAQQTIRELAIALKKIIKPDDVSDSMDF